MRSILFQIQQVFSAFFGLFQADSGGGGASRVQVVRKAALLRGLPAVVVALVGVLSIFAASVGDQTGFVERYEEELEAADEKFREVSLELNRDIARTVGPNANRKKIDEALLEHPKFKQWRDAGEAKIILLRKLIDLATGQDRFRYRLAKAYSSIRDEAKHNALIQELAPLDAPGYPAAQRDMAAIIARQARGSKLPQFERLELYDRALIHINNFLSTDETDLTALVMKANLLRLKGPSQELKDVLGNIFLQDPYQYKSLLRAQDNELDRQGTLQSARERLLEKIADPEVTDSAEQWTKTWAALVDVMSRERNLTGLINKLQSEFDRLNGKSKFIARIPQLKNYLSLSFGARALLNIGSRDRLAQLGQSELETIFGDFKESLKYNGRNESVLLNLTQLGESSVEAVAEAAKQLYDPETADYLPRSVLTYLGSNAVAEGDFVKAKRMLEEALTIQRGDRNPVILNNLAYAYLRGQDDIGLTGDTVSSNIQVDANHALNLITEAIEIVKKGNTPNQSDVSKFLHTRGVALMQLKNYTAAAADFERALILRRESVPVLESLVECYDALGLNSDVFRARLKAVQAKSNGDS